MKKYRGFISILLVLAIAVGIVALGGAGWWVARRTTTTSAVAPALLNYENSSLGFSFSYPQNLTLATSTNSLYKTAPEYAFVTLSSTTAQQYWGKIAVNEVVEGDMGPEHVQLATSTMTISGVQAVRTERTIAGDTELEISVATKENQYDFSFSYSTPEQRAVTDTIVGSIILKDPANISLGVATVPEYPSVAVSYPQDFVGSSSLAKAQQDRKASYMGVNCDDSLLCAYYVGAEGVGFEASSFSLAASSSVSYEDCTRITSAYGTMTTQKQINGITWYKDSTGDAGMGHRLATDLYRAYYNGACYEAYSSIAFNVGDGSGPDQALLTRVKDELDAIVGSLRFGAPSIAPTRHSTSDVPQWKTFSSATFPFSFSYPGALSSETYGGIPTLDGLPLTLIQNVGLATVNGDSGQVSIYDWSGRFLTLEDVKKDKSDPDVSGYESLVLGGEPALHSITAGGNESQWQMYWVVHKGHTYEVSVKQPLQGQIDQLLKTFSFTD